MSGVNKAIVIGRVGNAPEIKTFENGNRIATLSLATSKKYKNNAGIEVEDTTWHSVQVWGKMVDVVERFVEKGKQLYVEGEMQTQKWEKDGHTFQKTVINANIINLL